MSKQPKLHAAQRSAAQLIAKLVGQRAPGESGCSREGPGAATKNVPGQTPDRPPRPPSAHVDDHHAENIPADMRGMPCWVAWRWEYRDGKWTKPPIDPLTGKSLDATGPDSWMTFDEARELARQHGDGIGLAVGTKDSPSEFVPPDIDHCIDDQGIIDPRALELVAKFCTYAEITPSGRGLRIWIRAKKPGNRCKAPSHKDKFLATVELYEHSRYLTVTGRILEGVPAAIATRQAALNELYGAMFGGAGNHQGNGQPQAQSPVDVSDEALLEKARKAKNGAAFSALFDQGDTSRNGRDDSSADLALLNPLAFWTGCDSSRMETLFSASALGKREKWKERPDYRARSIDRAIADCTATYEPRPKSGAKPSSNGKDNGRQAATKRPDILDVEELLAGYKPGSFGKVSEELGGLVHLWINWLVYGTLSMVFSKPKIGKTRCYIQFIKVLWEALPWPDGSPNQAPKGSKTLVLPYDRNQLEIWDAMQKAGIPDNAAVCPHDPRDPTGICLIPLDDPLMKRVLAKTMADDPAIKLVIVDTLTYASGKSLYKPEDMKALLDDVMEPAMRHKCAILVLVHENKEGEALGRRIGERARIHRHLERINDADPNKLRLSIKNTNFKIPKPLLATHVEKGIEFQSGEALTEASKTIREQCARWMVDYLNQKHGIGIKVDYGTLIRAAGDEGYAGTCDETSRRWSDPTI